MDDLADGHQRRVAELVLSEEGLEAASAAVVRELCAAHVERRGVRGDLIRIFDEDEFGVVIEKPANQPGTGGPIHVTPPTGSPPHEAAATSWPRASTAARARSLMAPGK